MLAEIVTIGDELCRGEIVDTNSSWLAAELWQRGVEVGWKTSCRDVDGDIRRAIEAATARADVVLTSGGLGPTEDDLTVDALAGMVGVASEIHAPSRERWLARIGKSGMAHLPTSERQLRVPSGATVFDNPAGAAPGFEISIAGVPVFAMPGVPRELKAIFQTYLIGRLAELRGARGETGHIARRAWRTFGTGESNLASALTGLLDGAPGASLHYNVSFPETVVKLVVRADDEAGARRQLEVFAAELTRRLASHIYGGLEDSLAAVLGRELAERNLTLATAESCTGGLVGGLVTAPPGASRYYLGGAVCYADGEKTRALGVQPTTLAAHGAVSEAVVVEMARGARERLGADLAVAVSGVAGPDGGTPDKPVGDVWIAVHGPGERTLTKLVRWPGSRDQVRTLAAHWALAMCRRALAGGP